MRVLALDQSSRITGYAFFEDGKLIKSGIIKLTNNDLGTRLVQLRDKVVEYINEWNIEYIIYEDIQLQGQSINNVETFKVLAEVIGNFEELFTELNIPHEAVLSTVWKSAVGVKGRYRADQKKNAQLLVKQTYALEVSEDESDAICIGMYFCNKKPTFDWSD